MYIPNPLFYFLYGIAKILFLIAQIGTKTKIYLRHESLFHDKHSIAIRSKTIIFF